MGIETVLDLLQHYPRRYHDRTERAGDRRARGRRGGDGLRRGADDPRRAARAQRRADRRGRGVRRHRRTCASSFFNQAWRERQLPRRAPRSRSSARSTCYRGKRQMTNPVVDVLGRVGRARRPARSCPSTRSRGRPSVLTWQLRKLVGVVLRTHAAARASPTRSTPSCVPTHGLVDRDRAYAASTSPRRCATTHRHAAQRLKFDEFLRMQVGLVARKRALERGHRASSTGRRPARRPRSSPSLPFALTGDQRRAIDEIAARPRERRRRCTGCSRATSARARPSSRSRRCSSAVQGGLPGRVHGADRGAGRAALPHDRASCSHGLIVPADGTLLGERPVRVALLTNRTTAAERRRIAERPRGTARSTSWSARTRSSTASVEFPQPRASR